jgi:hypothetical protein
LFTEMRLSQIPGKVPRFQLVMADRAIFAPCKLLVLTGAGSDMAACNQRQNCHRPALTGRPSIPELDRSERGGSGIP